MIEGKSCLLFHIVLEEHLTGHLACGGIITKFLETMRTSLMNQEETFATLTLMLLSLMGNSSVQIWPLYGIHHFIPEDKPILEL